jgi:hypothetical protein
MSLIRHSAGPRHLISHLRLALACVLLLPSSAGFADEGPTADAQRVEERLKRLEDELQATRDELAASRTRVDSQQQVLERAGLTEEDDDSFLSGLSRFLEETEFEGWVTASYFWNFNRPKDSSGRGENTGNPVMGVQGDGLAYRLHPNHNSFQFDQAWFSMSREAAEESRGGFALDVVFGQTADALRGEDVAIYQAYAEYLAPVGPGFLIRAGRFASPLRVEPIQAMHRFNITEGLVAGQLHPDSHTGATISTQIGPIRLMAGGANDTLLDPENDFGDGKAVLFGVGFDVSETISVDANGVWGDSGVLPGSSAPGVVAPDHVTGKRMGIASAVVKWFPSDLLTTYLNFTYLWWTNDPVSVMGDPPGAVGRIPGDPEAYAVVVGSHYMVSDQTSFGFRGEAIWGKDNVLDPTLSRLSSGCKGGGTGCIRSDHHVWSLTGTLDHSFTDNVGFRVEARYDEGSTPASGFDRNFYRERNGLRRRQWTTGVEAYYRF